MRPHVSICVATYRRPRGLARLLDRTGQNEEARAQYLRFAESWRDADPQFQPLVEEALMRAAALNR